MSKAGIPEIGLKSLDPFHIGETVMNQGDSSSVKLDIALTDTIVTGWKHLIVTNVM